MRFIESKSTLTYIKLSSINSAERTTTNVVNQKRNSTCLYSQT